MAMKARQAGMQLQAVKTSSAAAKLAAETPSQQMYTNLQTSLSNKMITKEMIHGYMQHGGWNSTDGETYGKFGTPFKMQSVEEGNDWYAQYKEDLAEAKAELEGEIENWVIDYQAQGSTKQILNQMLLNPDMQVIEFEKFVDIKGNTAAGQFLKDQTFVISSIKKKGLKEKENNDQASLRDALSGASAFPVPNLTNTGQTLAMNQEPRTWVDDIMEIYR